MDLSPDKRPRSRPAVGQAIALFGAFVGALDLLFLVHVFGIGLVALYALLAVGLLAGLLLLFTAFRDFTYPKGAPPMSAETVTDSPVRRYRELPPEEVVEAFKYEGSFPLDFLTEKEEVRKARNADFAIEIVDIPTGETWIGVREGEYVVRFPTLGLRNYPADSFEYGFEEV
jgi:hypothetical protein